MAVEALCSGTLGSEEKYEIGLLQLLSPQSRSHFELGRNEPNSRSVSREVGAGGYKSSFIQSRYSEPCFVAQNRNSYTSEVRSGINNIGALRAFEKDLARLSQSFLTFNKGAEVPLAPSIHFIKAGAKGRDKSKG